MKSSQYNIYNLLSPLLAEYHYSILRNDWDKEMKRFHFSLTLPILSNKLKIFGVENFIAKVPIEKFSLMPDKFLAVFKNQEIFDTVLVSKFPSYVVITNIKTGVSHHITYKDVQEKWTGYILSFKEKPAITPFPDTEKKDKLNKTISCGVICFLLILSFYLIYSHHTSLAIDLLILIGIVGIIVSWQSFKTSLGYYNQKIQSICNIIDKGNCFSVIHSKGSQVMKSISLADLSLAFMIYSTSTAYCAIFNYKILFINELLIPLALALIVYSIIYQIHLQEYCIICLATSICVILQSCILVICNPLVPDYDACCINLWIGMVSICTTFMLKAIIRKIITLYAELKFRNLIYYNPNILNSFFIQLHQISIASLCNLPLIPLGDYGEKNIIILLSLSCDYCKDAYKHIRKLKYYHPLKYRIKLLIDTKTLDKVSQDIFLKLTEIDNSIDLEKACDDIFLYDMSLKKWIKKWGRPNQCSYNSLDKKIQSIEEFERENQISDVPTLIINNQIWPSDYYKIDDLLYNIQFMNI